MSEGRVREGGGLWPWRQTLHHEEPADAIYMRRWFMWSRRLIKLLGGSELHHFHTDDGDVPHDHPSWMLCIVLWGSAQETVFFRRVSAASYGDGLKVWLPEWGSQEYRYYAPGWVSFTRRLPRIRLYRLGDFTHRIHDTRNLWTFCIRGPHRRRWGFRMPDGSWVPHEQYRRRMSAVG